MVYLVNYQFWGIKKNLNFLKLVLIFLRMVIKWKLVRTLIIQGKKNAKKNIVQIRKYQL